MRAAVLGLAAALALWLPASGARAQEQIDVICDETKVVAQTYFTQVAFVINATLFPDFVARVLVQGAGVTGLISVNNNPAVPFASPFDQLFDSDLHIEAVLTGFQIAVQIFCIAGDGGGGGGGGNGDGPANSPDPLIDLVTDHPTICGFGAMDFSYDGSGCFMVPRDPCEELRDEIVDPDPTTYERALAELRSLMSSVGTDPVTLIADPSLLFGRTPDFYANFRERLRNLEAKVNLLEACGSDLPPERRAEFDALMGLFGPGASSPLPYAHVPRSGSTPALSAADNVAAGGAPGRQSVRRGNATLWISGEGIWWRDDFDAAPRDGSGGGVSFGGHATMSPELIAGLFGRLRAAHAEIDTLGQSLDMTGAGLGVYIARRLGRRLTASATAFWEHGFNDFETPTATADFDTDRFGVAASLSGSFSHGDWLLTPSAGVSYQEVHREAYVDSAGMAMSSNTLTRGQVTAGGTVAYRGFARRPGARVLVTPFASANLAFAFKDSDDFLTGGVTIPDDNAFGIGLGGGVSALFESGASGSLGASLGGLGADVQTTSVNGSLAIPLSAFGARRDGNLALGFSASDAGSLSTNARLRMPLQ